MSTTMWFSLAAPVVFILLLVIRHLTTIPQRRHLNNQIIQIQEGLETIKKDTTRIVKKREDTCREIHKASVEQNRALCKIIGDSHHATG